MLRTLYIRDFALIQELEVEFEPGLNIITGETGAGKSVLVGALKMILGERASTETVRSGARKAIIEGIFEDVDEEALRPLLEENGLDVSPTMILRREITGSQSRAFVNDSPATVQVQKDIASRLVDLHGQHEHQSLLHADFHVDLLDDFGGLRALREAYSAAREQVAALKKRQRELLSRKAELEKERDRLEFEIAEIDALSPAAGEEDELDAELRILENAERLHEATSELFEALYESDAAVYDRLTMVRNTLQELERIDNQFGESLSEMRSAQIAVGEVATFLQDYNARIEFNPERLDEIRERLGALEGLKRRYGGSLESVLAHRADIGERYDLASDFQGALARLSGELAAARDALADAAQRLAEKRREAGKKLSTSISEELSGLGIPYSVFEVGMEAEEDPDGWIPAEGTNWKAFETGMHRVVFLISTNKGEGVRPLARVASGGEVSRIMLAMKSILAKSDRLPILVFDEIDVGVSGTVAQRVGERMRHLAGFHQILTITHLPQVAAMGHAHYRVEKGEEEGRTLTRMRRLSREERAREVAMLMTGDDLSEAALRSAEQLMATVG